MITDEKEKAHVMLKLLEIAWHNFDRRRSYEWKLSLAIWTALAAFIALSLRSRFLALSASTQPADMAFVIVTAVVILPIQICFLYRVKRANNCDQNRALHYEYLINNALEVDFGPKTILQKDVEDSIKKATSRGRMGGWWSAVFHVVITIVLFTVAALVVFF